jgi:hypothetical protein
MGSKMALLFIVLALTSACTAPGDQVAKPIQTEVTETATGGMSLPPAWTPTTTHTASPIPSVTLTSSITLTPSITPTRTITPIPSITQTRDLTANPYPTVPPQERLLSATLRLTDLPQGYEKIPYLDGYLDTVFLEDQDVEVLAVSAFINEPSEILVMSMTFLFTSQADIDAFDQSIIEILEMIDEDLPLGTGTDLTMVFELLEDIQPIGDNSIALHIELEAAGETLGYDMLMFRRYFMGAMVMVMNLGGAEEVPSLGRLGIILDVKIIEALQ